MFNIDYTKLAIVAPYFVNTNLIKCNYRIVTIVGASLFDAYLKIAVLNFISNKKTNLMITASSTANSKVILLMLQISELVYLMFSIDLNIDYF